MLKQLLPGLLLLFAASLLRATIGTTASLEWLAVQTPLIVRGSVLESNDYTKEHKPGDQFRRLTLQVDEVIKGKYAAPTIIVETTFDVHDAGEIGKAEKGHPYLCFLYPDDREKQAALYGCRYVNTEPVLIDLQHPRHVYLANMKYADKPETILTVVRKWVAWKPAAQSKTLPEKLSDAFIAPGDGSVRLSVMNDDIGADLSTAQNAVLLQVPLSKETHQLVLERSRRPDILTGREGAMLLRYFPGRESERQLYGLLHSSLTMPQGDELTGVTHVIYPVRQAAYESLLALGNKVKQPEVSRQLSSGERVTAVRHWWTALAAQCLGRGWTCIGVRMVSTPEGWLRTAGGEGFAVSCVNRKATVNDDDHPQFTIYLMPGNWEGHQRNKSGEKFHPASYLGCNADYRVYSSSIGDADQVDPAAIARHFSLKEM